MRFAILSSIALHAAVVLGALRAGLRPHDDERGAVPVEISIEPTVTPPAPEPVPSPEEAAKTVPPARRASAASVRPSPPRSASSANTLAAKDRSSEPAPGPNLPLDLTGETVVLASTSTTSGGSGRADGDGARGDGPGGAPRGNGPTTGTGPVDRSGGVSLAEKSWACPWPHEADTQQIDEQVVVIKVVVGPEGRVESATLVSDPGHGFGAAAIACALHTRFVAARDRDGRPVRSESPPVRVQFTR